MKAYRPWTFGDRLHYQALDLMVCNEDLRSIRDLDLRELVKGLRRFRHDALWGFRDTLTTEASTLAYDADWAAHRLAVAVGVDAPLYRDDVDAEIDPEDVRTLLTYLRRRAGQPVVNQDGLR